MVQGIRRESSCSGAAPPGRWPCPPRPGLSEADYEWVSSDTFRALISASPLRRFILVPPLPDTGQDTAWVAEWETNTLSKFEGEISAKVCRNAGEIRRFLGSGADTRT